MEEGQAKQKVLPVVCCPEAPAPRAARRKQRRTFVDIDFVSSKPSSGGASRFQGGIKILLVSGNLVLQAAG